MSSTDFDGRRDGWSISTLRRVSLRPRPQWITAESSRPCCECWWRHPAWSCMLPHRSEGTMYTIREISDRLEITEVLVSYARFVATREIESVVGLFTTDAVLDYYGRRVVRGPSGIRELWNGSAAIPDHPNSSVQLDTRISSSPVVSNIEIWLDGDHARTTSLCLAVHAGVRAGHGTVLVNGSRNSDEFRREHKGWLISRRMHELLWSFEVPGSSGVRHR